MPQSRVRRDLIENMNNIQFNVTISPDDEEARAIAANNISSFSIPEGFKLAKIPKPHANRSPIYDWGVCVAKVDSDNEKGTLWFCRANSKCCSRRGISISGSNSNATRHLKEEHKIMSTKSGKLAAMAAVKADIANSGHYVAGLTVIKQLLPLSFFEDDTVRRAFSSQPAEQMTMQSVITAPIMRSIICDLYTSTTARLRATLADRASSSYLPPFHLHLYFWTDIDTKDKFLMLYIIYTSSRSSILAGADQCKSFPLAVRPLNAVSGLSLPRERYASMLVSWVTQVLGEFGLSHQDVFSVSSNSTKEEMELFQDMMPKHRGLCVTEAVSNALKKGFGISTTDDFAKNRFALEVLESVNRILQQANQLEDLELLFRDINASHVAACLNSKGDFPPQYWASVSKALEVVLTNLPVLAASPVVHMEIASFDIKVATELQALLGPAADLISHAPSFSTAKPRSVEGLVNLTHLRLITLESTQPLSIPKQPLIDSILKEDILSSSAPVWGEIQSPRGISGTDSGTFGDLRCPDMLSETVMTVRQIMQDCLDEEFFSKVYGNPVPNSAVLVLDMQAMLHPRLRNLAYLKHVVKDDSVCISTGGESIPRSDIYRNAVHCAVRNLAIQAYNARRQVSCTKGVVLEEEQPQAKRPRIQKSSEIGQDRLSALQRLGVLDEDEGETIENVGMLGGLTRLTTNEELEVTAEEKVKEEENRYLSGQGYFSKNLLLSEGLTFWMQDEICRLYPNLSAAAHAIYGLSISTSPPSFKQGLGLSVRMLQLDCCCKEDYALIEMILFLHVNFQIIPNQLSGSPILPVESRICLTNRFKGEDTDAISDL